MVSHLRTRGSFHTASLATINLSYLWLILRKRLRSLLYLLMMIVELRSLMHRWIAGSILHGVDPLSHFSFQPVLHDWCNKGCGMCYSVCGMMHIKEPLMLIGKSIPSGSSRFPLSLSEWSFIICLTPYNRK